MDSRRVLVVLGLNVEEIGSVEVLGRNVGEIGILGEIRNLGEIEIYEKIRVSKGDVIVGKKFKFETIVI
nr:hypothetical protein [Tanacetum cinerariifolium]